MHRSTSILLAGTSGWTQGREGSHVTNHSSNARSALDAQIKVLQGEQRSEPVTVQSIDMTTRLVTVRGPAGELRTLRAPESATRLGEVKVGDRVSMTYYDNIVIRKKAKDEPDVSSKEAALVKNEGPGGGTASRQTQTMVIEAINPKTPSISIKGKNGWTHITKIQNKSALEDMKVGDRVDVTWTEATLVSVTPAKQ
jgi:Cu/Ag efflux protein CusF